MFLHSRQVFVIIVALATLHYSHVDALRSNTDGGVVRLKRSVGPEDLFKAVQDGDVDAVKDLIAEGVDVNYGQESPPHDRRGYPLYLASQNNQTEIVDLLLDAGADVNGNPELGGTIIGAVENGHFHIVQKLLDAGFDPNTEGGFALIEAIKNGNVDIVEAYIAAGVDLNAKDGWIMSTAGGYGTPEIVQLILNANASNENYNAILSGAAAVGQQDIVEMMLKEDVDPTVGLTVAARSGQLDVVNTLLEAGAAITYSIPANPDQSPLHEAIIGGHIDVIEALVKYGADINAPYASDSWVDIYGDLGYHGTGWTVMHLAARWGYQSLLQRLVDLGADVNVVDTKGNTPLHAAVINLKLEVVKELIKLCADFKLPDKNGETPLDLAKRTVARDFSDLSQPGPLLKNLSMTLLKERVSYYPYTENYMKEIAKDLQERIQANKTLMEILNNESPPPSWSYIQVATRKVFEQKALDGILEAFNNYGCKFSVDDKFKPAIGSSYHVHCECLPKKARKLTVVHLPKGDNCLSVKSIGD